MNHGTQLVNAYAQQRLGIANPWAYLLPRGHYVALRTDNQYFVFEFARLNARSRERVALFGGDQYIDPEWDFKRGLCTVYGGTVQGGFCDRISFEACSAIGGRARGRHDRRRDFVPGISDGEHICEI
jgi:hypothetical protein